MRTKKQTSPIVPVRIPEDLLRRLIVLSETEGRSLNNEILLLARNAVAYFERTKGKPDAKALAAVDISAFCELNKEEENTDN